MANLTDVFSKFFSRFKNNSKKNSNDSLQFAQLLNDELINDLQLSISDYARNHIKNFDPDQDFHKLKKLHHKNNLFEDTKFPNKDSSVFLSVEYKDYLKSINRMSPEGHVIWRRAKHLSENATMAADKNGARCNESSTNEEIHNCYNTSDINQGLIGNWYLCLTGFFFFNIILI